MHFPALSPRKTLTEMGFLKGSSPALTDMQAAQASQLVRSSRDHRDIGSKLSRNLAQCLGCFLHDRVFKDRP
jgi:hypothetical protein